VKELLLPNACQQQACCMFNPLAQTEMQIIAGLLAALHKQSLLNCCISWRIPYQILRDAWWREVDWQRNDSNIRPSQWKSCSLPPPIDSHLTIISRLTLAAKARLPREAPRVSSGVQQQISREAATQPEAFKQSNFKLSRMQLCTHCMMGRQTGCMQTGFVQIALEQILDCWLADAAVWHMQGNVGMAAFFLHGVCHAVKTPTDASSSGPDKQRITKGRQQLT